MAVKTERFFNTLVIGSGCAGYSAACRLHDLGVRDVAILTEGVNMGTSRNTGSDKQTYYKLSIASGESDSVGEMAKTLFDGGSVHGDTALIEAACSLKAFLRLVLLGVPFPTNEYGEYVGYKTDHDPRQRATSCGPLTSKLMTEALERAALDKGIPIYDHMQVVKLLTENGAVTGLLAVDTSEGVTGATGAGGVGAVTGGRGTYANAGCAGADGAGHTGAGQLRVFSCKNIILATGGPAGIYRETVYPESQTGATGLAIEAGAAMSNLCEWQYGLASTKLRWNVSGTYQQVLPRYITIDPDGTEREFLPERFGSTAEALDMVFLKGYQWPFDIRKAKGSSRIDLLVHEEMQRGARVFMDFRTNPAGLDYSALSNETRSYLESSGATFGTPAERLEKMNPQAVKLYKDHGIDLFTEPLEVAVCAQHCNGGVAVDKNWESSVSGLFAAGEAAGTFGVYRPGGSALNSSQVGSMRAAEHIARKSVGITETEENAGNAGSAAITEFVAPCSVHDTGAKMKPGAAEAPVPIDAPEMANIQYTGTAESEAILEAFFEEARSRMSRYASFQRDPEQMKALYDEISETIDKYWQNATVTPKTNLPRLYKRYDTLLTQKSVLSAMLFAAENAGSRGSCIVKGRPDTVAGAEGNVILTQGNTSRSEPVRPLPAGGGWFETVWEEFNKSATL